MENQIKNEYITLYTAPALENSLNMFDEHWVYFFSLTPNWKYKIEEIEKVKYLWIWNEFLAKPILLLEESSETKKYIKVQKIARVKEIHELNIEFDEEKMNFIEKGRKIEDYVKKCFLRQFDMYQRYQNWKNKLATAEKWWYIICDLDMKYDIDEKTLYESKSIISFPLNRDKNDEYINSEDIKWKFKIWKWVYLNSNSWEIFSADWVEEISKFYAKIIELLTFSKEKKFSIDENQDDFRIYKDYSTINNNLISWFNKNKVVQKYFTKIAYNNTTKEIYIKKPSKKEI